MNDKGKLWNGSKKKQAKIRISLYGRQNIIQTGKDVVRVLGVPPYISIRINPEMDFILVEPAEEKHKLSFKVADDICFNKNRQVIISSASFVIGFMVKNNLDLSETYQIDGIYSEKNNAAVFQMKDAKVYEPKRKSV